MLTRRLAPGTLSLFALALALTPAATIACGGGVLHAGEADASGGAPPHGGAGDAAVDPVGAGSRDAGAEASRDATDATDATDAPSDPMAPCAGERDVFAYDVLGYPGPFQRGPQRFTNHDSAWTADLSSGLLVNVSTGPGAGGSIGVYGEVPSPGTYPQGAARPSRDASATPSFDLVLDHEGCGIASGTFTVTELTTLPASDGGEPRLRSFVASFDVQCTGYGNPPTIPVRGCMRFAVSP